jgi:hypothetical protein
MEPALDPTLILIVALIAAFVIYMVATRGKREQREVRLAAERDQAQVQAKAKAMMQWREAFVLANPGQPVPAPPMMAVSGSAIGMSDRTNTLAILTLIFGVLGGYLAIVFGHIAISQIRRTGERGGGMAIAGLVLGYLWLAVTVILVLLAGQAGAFR